MDSSAWFDYFTRNQRADGHIERVCGTALDPDLRRELALSLARFQLGEASGGRIAEEVETARDPALDLHNRRAIQFYVLEEARHARELAALVLALGGTTLTQHWSSDWFRRVRRCLGLRTKMLTMAAAEVVGIVYYTLLRERVACSTVERTLALIAREETRHLNFQASGLRAQWRMPGGRCVHCSRSASCCDFQSSRARRCCSCSPITATYSPA